MRVELVFDDKELREFVKAWEEPAVKRTLGAAASAWGKAAKPILKAETPVARPGNAYATGPGNLQKLTRYKRIRASLGIGVVVAAMGKGAFYRGWVTGGTKAHRIRFPDEVRRGVAKTMGSIRHPGAKPNPFVERAGRKAESAGFDAAEKVIFDGLDGKQISEVIDT